MVTIKIAHALGTSGSRRALVNVVIACSAVAGTSGMALAAGHKGKSNGGGQSLLNQMLGPKTGGGGAAPTKTAKTKPSVKPDSNYHPNAINKVDQRDLIKNLTDQRRFGHGPKAEMKKVLARMHTSSTRLTAIKPGHTTQDVQRRIILSLDKLIKMAKKGGGGGGKGSGKPKHGMSKKMNNGSSSMSGSGPHHEGGSHAATKSQISEGSHSSASSNGSLFEQHRGWGNLPPQARQAIANGIQQKVLPRYKSLVQDYYKKLGTIGTHKAR